MTFFECLLILFVMAAIPLTFIGVPIFVFTGGLQKFALKPLQRRYDGLTLRDLPRPGDVYLVYHTYRGFLVWLVQDEHRAYAPPQDARLLLSRLLRFNLSWGLLSYGAMFVPLVAVLNYFAQKRSIARQERQFLLDSQSRPAV